MITQFKQILNKQLSHIKATLPPNQTYSPQQVFQILSQFQIHLHKSFLTIAEATDKKINQTQTQLKNKNKSFNQLKSTSRNQEINLAKENDGLKRELQRYKYKVHELLRHAQKCQEYSKKKREVPVFQMGTQSNMKDEHMEKILQQSRKQNIFLKQKISKLQEAISDDKEQIQGAHILIKELVRQLETNIADRQTWNGTGSSNASDLDSMDRLDESIQLVGFQVEQRQQASEDSADCNRRTTQDCSTIDGSNTTHKDFALTEWLQFDEWTDCGNEVAQGQDQECKMWPELLWDRCRQILGLSFQV